MNSDQLSALCCFVLPGVIMMMANQAIAAFINRVNGDAIKWMGSASQCSEKIVFSKRAIMILGLGWFLVGITMMVLWS